MNNIIGFAFLTLLTRTLSDCNGDKFGYNSAIQVLYIYENGTFNPKNEMTLEIPVDQYTGKIWVIH